MLAQNQTAETRNGSQAGDEHRFTRAAGKNTWSLLFCKAVKNMDSVSDADPDHQGECHDIGWVERDAEVAHEAAQPKKADSNGNERKGDRQGAAEMNKDQKRDGRQ